MSREQAWIERLATIAHHPAARGLRDDAAVLPLGDRDLVLTHDMIVEGVHYLPDDPPGDVAWKLVAVNLSDLAAKGARPLGVLLGYPLGENESWDAAFASGLAEALGVFEVPLLGGDTVRAPIGARTLGLTAIGETEPGGAPSRSGARAGDDLWVTGTIGAAGVGLTVARRGGIGDAAALRAYRRPQPRLAEGRALAPYVTAMADVSDGLLIDAARIGVASNVAVEIALDRVPFADAIEDRLSACCAGDDYELLFAAPAGFVPPPLSAGVAKIGRLMTGAGLRLRDGDDAVPLPDRIGWEHD